MQFQLASAASLLMLASQALAVTDAEFLAFSQPNSRGSVRTLGILKDYSVYCQIWADRYSGAILPPIRSYLAGNITCLTYPTKDCSGNSNNLIRSGKFDDVNIVLSSLICDYTG